MRALLTEYRDTACVCSVCGRVEVTRAGYIFVYTLFVHCDLKGHRWQQRQHECGEERHSASVLHLSDVSE